MPESDSRHTAASIAALISKNVESSAAEDVLEALKPLHGQLITTRLLDKLPGGRVEWRLSRTFGWTEIKNRAHVTSGGDSREAVSLMVARSEASVPLDVTFVEKANPKCFAERRKRNAQRAKALSDARLLERVAVLMNEIEDVNRKHQHVRKQFAVFLEQDGELLSADQVPN